MRRLNGGAHGLRHAAMMLGGLVIIGCATGGERITVSPLSITEQQQAILKIVPLDTSRDEVDRRLREAGIEFTPGVSSSVYYCDVWNRPNGERWQLDVALLFNDSGRLYQTRRGQADTGLAAGNDAGVPPPSAQAVAAPSQTQAPADYGEGSARGDGPRTPFAPRGAP